MTDAAEKLEEETPAQEESVQPVDVNRFGPADEKRNHFVIYCKQGTNPDCVLQVEFWEHISRFLDRGDIVEVLPEDLSWEMNVRVLDKGPNWAMVRKRDFIRYGEVEVQSEMPNKYDVKWTGPVTKFRVIFNGEKLKDGFATEELGRRYASNHAQALKR